MSMTRSAAAALLFLSLPHAFHAFQRSTTPFGSTAVRPRRGRPSLLPRHMFFEKQVVDDRFGSERERKLFTLRVTKNHTDLLTDPTRIAPLPEPVAARAGLTGTAFVSGWCEDPGRSDQFVFDLLHRGEAFGFDRIECFCDDAALTKKLMSSRSARNSGLLDMLSIIQSPSPGADPSASHLYGVSTWVARVPASADRVRRIASAAAEGGVENLAVLVEGAATAEDLADMEAALAAASEDGALFDYSLLHAHRLVDGAEGGGYRIANATDAPEPGDAESVVHRDEACRLITELLSLDFSKGRAIKAKMVDVNDPGAIWLRALRNRGYSRPQELEALLSSFNSMKSVAFYEFARDDQARYKGLIEGSIQLTPEEIATRAAAAKRQRKKEYKELVKREVAERQAEILEIVFKKLKVVYEDSRYRRGAITEEEWNKLYFAAFLDEALFIWDTRNGGKSKRPDYHTAYDKTWVPQMVEKYGKPERAEGEKMSAPSDSPAGGIGADESGISSDFKSPFGM